MTRKDYEKIAKAFLDARNEIMEKEWEEHHNDLLGGVNYAVDFVADALAADNYRFDKSHFRKACGLEE